MALSFIPVWIPHISLFFQNWLFQWMKADSVSASGQEEERAKGRVREDGWEEGLAGEDARMEQKAVLRRIEKGC